MKPAFFPRCQRGAIKREVKFVLVLVYIYIYIVHDDETTCEIISDVAVGAPLLSPSKVLCLSANAKVRVCVPGSVKTNQEIQLRSMDE